MKTPDYTPFLNLLKSKGFFDATAKHHEQVKNHPELYSANGKEKLAEVEEMLQQMAFNYTLNAEGRVFVNIKYFKEFEFFTIRLFLSNQIESEADFRINILDDFNSGRLEFEIRHLTQTLSVHIQHMIGVASGIDNLKNPLLS